VNLVYLWTSGPHEAVLQVALKPKSGIRVAELEERLRKKLPALFPNTQYSFEAGDIVSQVLSMGSSTPVEITVAGPKLEVSRQYGDRLMKELTQIPTLRDLQFSQSLDYPTVNVQLDRIRAGQLGVTTADVARSLVAATSSSRLVQPIFWRDPSSGVAYQVQIEIPQHEMASLEDVRNVPVMPASAKEHSSVYVRDVAEVARGTMIGQYDRYNMQRMITLTANVAGEDLGRAADRITAAVARVGQLPKAVTVAIRGQIAPMRETLDGLRVGLGLTAVVILLLLAANFQSFKNALIVLSTLPAVLLGVVVALLLTRTTINVQSFLGAIMAIGVAVANAILLVSFADTRRFAGADASRAALEGAEGRLRPILMTSLAMMVGMIPMALGLGEGGEQTAPLARSVIGGLLAATAASLIVLPSVFALVHRKSTPRSPSLDPDDPQSPNHHAQAAKT